MIIKELPDKFSGRWFESVEVETSDDLVRIWFFLSSEESVGFCVRENPGEVGKKSFTTSTLGKRGVRFKVRVLLSVIVSSPIQSNDDMVALRPDIRL